jgi:ABC-type branched-subunit amino acid transport system substrate-binding protein
VACAIAAAVRLALRVAAHGRGFPFLFMAFAVLVLFLACPGAGHATPPPKSGSRTPRAVVAPTPPPVLLGEINTYKGSPGFSTAYRRGWMLALEQINAAGGVLGRKLDVRSRDDHGKPEDAVQAAQALVDRDGVVALFGGNSSEVALALSRYADASKVLYLAVAPLTQRLTWQEGNRHTFRLRPAAWMQAAAVAPKALGQRKLRWALVYEDTESDRATVEAFKGLMRTFQSKTEFVADQAVPPGKFDATATVAALKAAQPEALFNMLTGARLAGLVQAGLAAHLFDGLAVVSLFTGDPDNLAVLDAGVPDGWIVTGYPSGAVDTPASQAFVQAYQARYGETPGTAALLGYAALQSIAQALKQAGIADRQALVATFPRLNVETPFGPIVYRSLDHQSTLGTYLGYIGHADGKPTMERFAYASGTRLQPLDEQIRKLRAQDHAPAGAGRHGTWGRPPSAQAGADDAQGRESLTGGAEEAPTAAREAPTTASPSSGSSAAATSTASPAAAGDATRPPAAPPATSDTAQAGKPQGAWVGKHPVTDLERRLRAARPDAAPAASPTASSAVPPPASPVASTSSRRRNEAPFRVEGAPPDILTPALADWPDQVQPSSRESPQAPRR